MSTPKQSVIIVFPWGRKMAEPRRKWPSQIFIEKLNKLFTEQQRCSIKCYGNTTSEFTFEGSDADQIFAIAEPFLSAHKVACGGKVIKKFGPRKDSATETLKWKDGEWAIVRRQGTRPKLRRPAVKKPKKPTLTEARKLVRSPRRDYRERGFKMLIEMDRRDEVASFAMREQEFGLAGKVVEWLYPAPTELVVRVTTMQRGAGAYLEFRYGIAYDNYIYVHDALAEAYRPRKNRLHPRYIESAGLSYCRPFAPFLEKYLHGKVMTQEEATIGGKKKGRRKKQGTANLDQVWCRETRCAIDAAVALRRMDLPVDPKQVERLLAEVSLMRECYTRRKTIALLKWVLWDLGEIKTHHRLCKSILDGSNSGAGDSLPDLLTTLLKRGERKALDRIVDKVASTGYTSGLIDRSFIYWPLANHLDNRGLLTIPHENYHIARSRKTAPPPWWKWERK